MFAAFARMPTESEIPGALMLRRRKSILVLTAAVAAVAATVAAPQAGAQQSGGGDPEGFAADAYGDEVAGEWIVTIADGASVRRTARDLTEAHGGHARRTWQRAVRGFHYVGSEAQARAVAADDRVTAVVPNQVVSATADVDPTGIVRIDADDARAAGRSGDGVTVAILDTGIDLDHPDLVANLHPSLGVDCIGGGYDDANGHGTHVAGTVAASLDGSGVVGGAPGALLVPVRVLDASGVGSFASLICGIDYVTANASTIGVANMSLSGTGSAGHCGNGGLREAICESVAAGVTYVVAAGNESTNANTSVPARYPEVITVSALDDRDGTPAGDVFAGFSNYGSVVDVIGPGVAITSTVPGGYASSSGTSMASPHVAAVAALAREADPSLSPADVRALLRTTGECPNATIAGADGGCAGQGVWSGDPDGTSEPLVNAVRASETGTGISHAVPSGEVENFPWGYRLTVRAVVHEADETPIAGATMTFFVWFSDGTSISGPCTSGANGSCEASGWFPYSRQVAGFAVTAVAHPDFTYDRSGNHPPGSS